MTKREFYEVVINANINDEVTALAQGMLEVLDKTNETRRVKAAEKALEKEAVKAPIREAIVSVLTAEPKTATTLIEEAGVDVTPQSIPSLLKGLVEAGAIEKVEIKVPSKGKRMGYFINR